MSKFTYYIPKLEYPQRGLFKTASMEFGKWSILRKSTFITLIIFFIFQFSPWYEIGDIKMHATNGISSFVGILIFTFLLIGLFIFFSELIALKFKASKESMLKVVLFIAFQLFILSSIGFSISHNINSLTQEARPLMGSFLSLLASLIFFMESVILLVYEKPAPKTNSSYLIPEDNIEESLDEYLETRRSIDKREEAKPSKEQSKLFE